MSKEVETTESNIISCTTHDEPGCIIVKCKVDTEIFIASDDVIYDGSW